MLTTSSECPDRINDIFTKILHSYLFWGFKDDLKKSLAEPSKQIDNLDLFLKKFPITSSTASALKSEVARVDDENVMLQRFQLFS